MRDTQYPGRSVVTSTEAMIATSQPMATQVGLQVLKDGGNALDAAIAACATLCVTEPASTGIGGDCFILYHEAKTGKLHGLNGSGRAPGRASLEEYKRLGHQTMPERGIHSLSVPGAIRAWETALQRFGTMGLDQLLQPAIRYGEEGYAISPIVGANWKSAEPLLSKHPDSVHNLLVNGKAPLVGTRHRQPNLAKSMRKIAKGGAKVFYEGEIAQDIVKWSHENGGLFEMEDFANHSSDWVDPISTDYRGLRMFEIPPNGQGITALMTLNILEQTQLGTMKHLSPDYIHTFTEAFRLATAERNKWVSDPEFNDLPVQRMLSKDFAREQWQHIDPAIAAQHPIPSHLSAGKDTIYLSVVDKDRNCCSFINSLFAGFGSGLVAGATGITLQNRGAGFNLEEGHLNCIAPNKRPMHTIIPSMVYRGDEPVLCFGVMGGQYQAMGHSYVFTNWLDFGMDLQEAVDAPRFLPMYGNLQVERPIPHATHEAHKQRGHNVVDADNALGGAQVICIDGEAGVLSAASEPRKDGFAMGY